MSTKMETANDIFGQDDRRWAAVSARDRGADGAFVFAMKTTGIYCRPSCGARRGARHNVVFFSTCEAAERDGFRACLRCKPKEAPDQRQREAVAVACRALQSDKPPALVALATKA